MRFLIVAAFSGFITHTVGILSAHPVFEGDRLWVDRTAAKQVSGIDIYAVGTNLWKTSDEERAGKIIGRAALDKPRYQLGEPIHLFIYYLHHSPEINSIQKVAGWMIIRPAVLDDRNRAVPLTPTGEWHATFSDLSVAGEWAFPSNRIQMVHIDLTELFMLTEPGQYLAFPRIRLFPESSNPDLPVSMELRAIPFEVTATPFERPTNAPPSVLAMMYQQHINEQAGRRLPLTDLEKELAAQSEKGLKEAMERHRQFMEAQAREAALTNVPAAPPRPVAPQLQVETDVPSRRPLRWPLLAAVAAVLAVLGWLWRRRGA